MNNPIEALPPQKLQAKIQDVLTTNPEHADAVIMLWISKQSLSIIKKTFLISKHLQHYLSYLNCMRAKEFCGSIDSLFHYFDRKTSALYEDDNSRCKGLRYAALNLAILQAKFNHKLVCTVKYIFHH